MRRTRVIPVLLIHKEGVYKTYKFKKPVYIGDPVNAIRLFNDLEVDEIAVLDIDASKDKRPPNYEMIKELTSEAFMPFSYGGGITNTDQASRILQCGIEKIILNHGVQEKVELISECAKKFGSSSVVVSIDYVKKFYGGYFVYDHVSKKALKIKLLEAVLKAEEAGAGEILINSVDRDGLMKGLDNERIGEASRILKVPLVACGGAGSMEHLREAEDSGCSAVAAGSLFVFYSKQKGVLINYPKETELQEYLK